MERSCRLCRSACAQHVCHRADDQNSENYDREQRPLREALPRRSLIRNQEWCARLGLHWLRRVGKRRVTADLMRSCSSWIDPAGRIPTLSGPVERLSKSTLCIGFRSGRIQVHGWRIDVKGYDFAARKAGASKNHRRSGRSGVDTQRDGRSRTRRGRGVCKRQCRVSAADADQSRKRQEPSSHNSHPVHLNLDYESDGREKPVGCMIAASTYQLALNLSLMLS